MGAYQEILGDLHNLFGDTNAVHVRLNEQGEVVLDAVIKGDTVAKCWTTCSSTRSTCWSSSGGTSKPRCAKGRIGYEESGRLLRFYEEGLHGYTYLEDARAYS